MLIRLSSKFFCFVAYKRMEWNEIDFKVWEAEKANGIESTSRWFQTN